MTLRQALEAELDRIGDRAAAMALTELEPLVEAARRANLDATAERVDLRDGLNKLVTELQALVTSGEALLGMSGAGLLTK